MIREYVDRMKKWVLEQVLWAERELKGKSGKEKKLAVVLKLDEMVRLPVWLEWADGPVIAWMVDRVCDTLNAMCGHKWPEEWSEEDVDKTEEKLPDPNIKDGDENAGTETD